MAESKAARLSNLIDEVVTDLGNGTFDEYKIAQVRLLWATTPDSQKDGIELTLKQIEDMVANLRRDLAVAAGAGKVQRFPVVNVPPCCAHDGAGGCCDGTW